VTSWRSAKLRRHCRPVLRGLFGPGILDVPITGNEGTNAPRRKADRAGYSTKLQNRRTPGAAHGYYFRFYEENSEATGGGLPVDVMPLLHRFLDLTMEAELAPLLNAPHPLPETYPVQPVASGATR